MIIKEMRAFKETENLKYFSDYFDHIDDHINQLEEEAERLMDCMKIDEISQRIAYLKECDKNGMVFVDNDCPTHGDAWKTLPCFTPTEAIKKYHEWCE